MRILAIRGKNLTSLEGSFALDLEHGPLGDAGIFAIAGPTGAGKSTLLDALCVALYNKTPRLGGLGGVEVGRDGAMRGIPANDPRNLLRDGAGEGYAEVDFLGRDAKRWRARWSVWRARKRSEGTLQAVELTLEELVDGAPSGTRVGGKLTETLAAIEERVGLDFDQFRRAVLLAQGDFAAFLRAKPADRASLLEQMTGTKIYGEVSKRAYDRAAREAEALQTLEARLADAKPAEEAARAGLEAEVASTSEARGRAEAELARVRAALAWYAAAAQRAADLAAAERERALAEQARTALQPDRALLAAVEAAEPARAAVEGLDAAARRLADARRAEETRTREAGVAAEAARVATEATVAAEAAVAVAEQARADATPTLQEARALDVRLTEATRRAAATASSAKTAVDAADEARRRLGALEVARTDATTRLAEHDAWLAERAASAAVAERWGELQVHLDVLATEVPRRAGAVAAAPRLAEEETRAADGETRAAADLARLQAEAGAARERAAAAKAAAEASQDADRPLRRATLTARRDGLLRCGELVEQAARLAEEVEAERAGIARAAALAAEAEATAGKAAQTAALRVAMLQEARDGLRRAQAALDLAGHRATLRAGEHCPLCGATAHPWADGSPLAGLLDDQSGRVAALETEVAALKIEEAGARARHGAAGDEAARGRARLVEKADRRAALERGWGESRVAPLPERLPWRAEAPAPEAPSGPGPLFARGGSVSGADARGNGAPGSDTARAFGAFGADARGNGAPGADAPDAHEAVAALVVTELATTRAALDALAKAEQEAEAAQRALVAALGASADAEARAAAANRAVDAAARAREAAARARAENARVAEEAAVRIDAALLAAAPAFPDTDKWRASATTDPALFRQRCEKAVAEWNARREARARVAEDLARIEQERAVAVSAAADRTGAADKARAEADTAATELGSLRSARAALFGGADADVVERDLDRAATDRRAARDRARAAALTAGEAATAARAAATAATEERARREAEATEARAALDAVLVELGLPEATLREHLARDRRWKDGLRQRLADADRAVAEAVARAAERLRAVEAHAATRPAEAVDDQAALSAALPRAEAAQRAADEAWSLARAALLQDDDRRARSATLLPEVAAQRVVTDRWRILGRLIGSRDGNSFRKFAQSLTLNLLLVEANGQLASLNPRYRLQRVPHEEMELQVEDLHMADQVRPLTSLSGGETFLVSLALALGLASLAATRTRVESIFIDEGFGTLDADTLDIALATLEGLRAEGRTVGVISHVGGLAERIGTWVSVEKAGPGRSRVEIVTG